MSRDLPARPLIAARYQLQKALGVGSMATTWLAHDTVRDQTVVIKIVQPKLIQSAGGFGALAEVLRITCSFRHPSVMRVFDFAQVNDEAYISMEYFRGRSLRALLEQSTLQHAAPIRPEWITQIIVTIADILQDGQEVGLPHGGIKPENIYFHANNEIRLSEYGLHKAIPLSMLKASAALQNAAHYLAPELYRAETALSFQTDQFALGVVWKNLLETVPDSERTQALSEQKKLALRLMAPDPEQRFTDIEALQRALAPHRAAISQRPEDRIQSRPPTGKIITRIGIAATAVVLIWSLITFSNSPPLTPSLIIERSNLKQLVRANEQERMALLVRGLIHPELQAAFRKHFNAQGSFETIESYYERTAIKTSTPKESVFRNRLNQTRSQLAAGNRFLDAFERCQKWEAQLEKNTRIPAVQKRAWLPPLQSAIHFALEHFEAGLFERASSRLESNLTTLTKEVYTTLDLAITAANASQQRWAEALRQRNTPYAEPNTPLSSILESLDPDSPKPDHIDRIAEATLVADTYEKWISDWETLPEKTDQHFQNSLGMLFRSVGAIKVSIWETRVIDFFLFVQESGFDENRFWREEAHGRGPTHPVTAVARYSAAQFCEWLTRREHRLGILPMNEYYALPTDLEWSLIAGLSSEQGETPLERHTYRPNVYPWSGSGRKYSNHGNYFTASSANEENNFNWSTDRFHETAPVAQFAPNSHGLYDLGGNVWEWVSTPHRPTERGSIKRFYTLRGAGWRTINPEQMQTGFRMNPPSTLPEAGFRSIIRERKGNAL